MPATAPASPDLDDLVVLRPEGLYCPPGDFYIDPWRPVARAVITHAHADHARVGHGHYLAAAPSGVSSTATLACRKLASYSMIEMPASSITR